MEHRIVEQKGTRTQGLGNAQSVHILKDNKEDSGRIPKMWLDCH